MRTISNWFGFGSSIVGIVDGLILSTIADTRRFQHTLKTFILVSLIGCLCGIVWFELCVHSLFYDKHILSFAAVTIGLSTAIAGLFSGAATPLIYEALAEIMFPLPESLSESILVQWINIISLIFLFVAPNRDKLVNFLVLVVGVSCIVMVVLTRFTYRRRDEDERQRVEKEQNQAAKENNTSLRINVTINEQSYGTFD
ncbi:unnamed protein product [Rotaria magnacalcarata]|uniref:Uncharacterized protein n=1 Tax=Rotaria magnacalcarata TaxID=392030 RepID=A0A819XIC2_9BILA|nr:unnamed protein product [Rotaria magnacalcarata]CAF4141558.1 unnamed protein product [Rotaria magnacalcarata]